MNTPNELYPCPCCGYLVFGKPPGSNDICPICFWEDYLPQLRFPTMGGANVPLIDAQQNFVRVGANVERDLPHVRPPGPEDRRDPLWRPLDPAIDDPEKPVPGRDYGNSYPRDTTTLYYWRPTYWRGATDQGGGTAGT